MDRSNLVDMGSFLDNLTSIKDDNLRSIMNSSAVIGKAPKQVVAPKDRNPQTIDELRQEKADIILQSIKQKEGYQQVKLKWDTEKLITLGIGIFIIGKVI